MFAPSVNVPALTSTVVAPLLDGVKVAVYDAPLPLKFEIVPPLTVISPAAKLLTDSEIENTNPIELSLVTDPSVTPLVDDEIAINGAVPSYVHVNVFEAVLLKPAASVNLLAATVTDVWDDEVDVNVAE